MDFRGVNSRLKPNLNAEVYSFSSEKDINLRGHECFHILRENDLSSNAAKAFEAYTGEEYELINGYERVKIDKRLTHNGFVEWDNNTNMIVTKEQIKLAKDYSSVLSSEIKKHAIKKNVCVYKLVSWNRLENMLMRSQRGNNSMSFVGLQGKFLNEPGFTSTTLFREYVQTGGCSDYYIALRIIVPAGIKGVYLGKISRFESENELLLDKGMKFKITSVNPNNKTIDCIIIKEENYVSREDNNRESIANKRKSRVNIPS